MRVLALRELQTRFLRSIAATPGPSSSHGFDAELVALVDGDGSDRLEVYAQMYWVRLHDALREDFPRVAAILGEERFSVAVRAYLARYPSSQPSVRHLGDRFAAFLTDIPEAGPWPYLPDLARLEWARLAIFDAPDAPPLCMDDLRVVAPDAWPGLTFRLVPAADVLHSRWPIHELWAVAEGSPPESMHPAETHLRIWRDGFTVYQAPMDACERRALESVVAGHPFAAMCEALEALVGGPQDAAREAAQLVLRWIEDGLLARPCTGAS